MFKLKEHHKSKEWRFALSISNPYDPDQTDHCLFHIAAFSHSFWFEVPELFKPRMWWIDMATHEQPSKGYWKSIRREYGFTINSEAFHIQYGIQPGEWTRRDPENSDHSKCYFIPWNQHRRVRYEFLKPDGGFWMTANDKPNGAIDFDAIELARNSVPKIQFKFNDFDGREIIATCHIEKTTYRRGTGLFSWLGYIVPKKVYRKLDMHFSDETGRQSNTFKGGIIRTSTKISEFETPLDAFTRYGTSEEYEKGYGLISREFTKIKII